MKGSGLWSLPSSPTTFGPNAPTPSKDLSLSAILSTKIGRAHV